MCENMLQLSIQDDKPTYVCNACHVTQECDSNFDACVYKANYGGNEKIFYELFINKYSKYDPTLPCVTTIQCPNKNCTHNGNQSGKNPEVIYIRYNDADMKYIYLCCSCDFTWICPEYEKMQPLFMKIKNKEDDKDDDKDVDKDDDKDDNKNEL